LLKGEDFNTMNNESRLITNPRLKSTVAEAYKILRTNIQFSSLDKQLKVLLITSPGATEGKSTTASNLAIAMAQTDKKVLLIDCDLRKPSIHRVFGLVNEMGLANVLVEGLDYHRISNLVDVPNLEVLTSGPKPPNPPELLGSARMKDFIAKVREEYDTVILDTPPVLPVTDAAILSTLADGVVFVISHGKTQFNMAVQAKENLEKVDSSARIIGTVINNIPSSSSYGHDYYYYYDEEEHSRKRRSRRRNAK